MDKVFFELAVTTYAAAALALFTFFLSRATWLRTLAIPLAIAGCASQFAELVARNQISGVWPLTNLYGSLSLFSAMSVAIFIGFAFKYDLWFIGGFVLALADAFLSYASTWNEGSMPAVPALQSYWIKIHVPIVVSSYAAFLVAFVVASLYLVKHYAERRMGSRSARLVPAAAGAGYAASVTLPAQAAILEEGLSVRRSALDTPNLTAAAAEGNFLALWLNTLPSLAKLDVLTYRIVAIGLPLLTVGIITGAWWAKEAWGAYWQWDPKETAALFCWIVYAIYMHLHTRNAWRGVRTAWVAFGGFFAIMFCYLGVNIWISGLHSYKM